MKVHLYLESPIAVRDFGASFDLDVDTHPRDQLAQSQCVVGRYSDGRELTIPAQSIAIVATGERKK